MQVRANQPATMSQDTQQPETDAHGPQPAEGDQALTTSEQVPSQGETQPEGGTSPLLPGLLVFGGVLVLTMTLMNANRRRQSRMHNIEADTPAERLEHLRAAAAADAGIEGRVARAADIIRDASARLETKAARLEILLEHADQRIAKLERALEQREPAPVARETRAPDPLTPTESDPLKAKVFSLADEGLTPIEIAERTDQHVGKIELILALRRA